MWLGVRGGWWGLWRIGELVGLLDDAPGNQEHEIVESASFLHGAVSRGLDLFCQALAFFHLLISHRKPL